ncbi:hypothetical protein, unlikely [Trypanosoma brucei gambiense DAL972]|uniref:Uncharacterized protein n=1 Tax=Trypanosoma brucei gambiense (strain MHOM/CI/86/DAL972) TaxID=679716 RepID=D0A1K5_TRYB9|nr:hypothetical protein, unlikely [Trypanosoma brucei gambiense DAL972]CBH15147.1 hypothetical protein, unlikely [Trypanosoma brucei gambiense DAL972]|eukprot:XP_011777413.1 hypothetical protein, unlikely [Trypanosoma brucei gambiense DAL972]
MAMRRGITHLDGRANGVRRFFLAPCPYYFLIIWSISSSLFFFLQVITASLFHEEMSIRLLLFVYLIALKLRSATTSYICLILWLTPVQPSGLVDRGKST